MLVLGLWFQLKVYLTNYNREDLDGCFAGLRGVDHKLFSPEKAVDLGLPKPIFLYVGRLAVEKILRHS